MSEDVRKLREEAVELIKKQAGHTVSVGASERHAIYADLEELITPGFLTQSVSIGDVDLVMKTLYPGEYVLLKNRLGRKRNDRVWREWCIAMSVWMIDGQVLLEDANAAVAVRQSLQNMPSSAIDTLFSIYTNLNNRFRKAMRIFEAYCYEDFSRAIWRMVGRTAPSRDAGIPGASSLGMNMVQRLWVAYNLAEDDRETMHRDWSMAKLITSATAPKGVRKLNQRDESDRNLEDARRKSVINKAYYDVTGVRIEEETDNGMLVSRAVSPEELAAEMERWVRGEKDDHDRIVDAYKESIRAKTEADKAYHAERMQKLEEIQEDMVSGPSVVGYTLEQYNLLREKQGLAPRQGSVVIDKSKSHRLYDKYISQEIKAGAVTENGANPITAQSQTLDESLQGRRVMLTDEDI